MERKTFFKRGILLFIVIIGLWLLWGFFAVNWLAGFHGGVSNKDQIQILGQIGDIFGGVNALFAALAFFGVAVAAHFQYQTLKLVEEQSVRDKFEPLFFELLAQPRLPPLLNTPTNSNWWKVATGTFEKGDSVDLLRGALAPSSVPTNDPDWVKESAQHIFQGFYFANEDALSAYMRSLFHLFSFIFTSGLSETEKQLFSSIARSRLGRDEVLLLALNGISPQGQQFKPLIEYYSLLRHIREKTAQGADSVDSVIAKACYSPLAVANRATRLREWRMNPTQKLQLEATIRGGV